MSSAGLPSLSPPVFGFSPLSSCVISRVGLSENDSTLPRYSRVRRCSGLKQAKTYVSSPIHPFHPCVCVCVYVCGRARANTRGKRGFVVASSTHALRESDLVKMLKRKTKASTLRHRLPRLLLRHCQRQTFEKKPCWAQQKASVRMSERVTRAQLALSSSRLTFLSVASIQNFHCVAMETFHPQPQASRRPAPSRHSAHWTHLRAGMLTGETA